MRAAFFLLLMIVVSAIETSCREASVPEGVAVSFPGSWVPLDYSRSDVADDSLRVYAVNIIWDPPQEWTGYGIYLGGGLVLTAAHVVGSAARTRPSVPIAGRALRATPVKEGSFEAGAMRESG
jgi:hypothetical protein